MTKAQDTVRIEPYRPEDRAAVIAFNDALQEHERVMYPQLKTGAEIGQGYTDWTLRNVAENDGIVLVARAGAEIIGFVCAWKAEDEDQLLKDDHRRHALVSDLYVAKSWRRRGVGAALMTRVEAVMRDRGCTRIRVCAKAGNLMAVESYKAGGYVPYEIIFAKSLTG